MPISTGKTISIHASTRGATSSGSLLSGIVTNFNPRFHERSDGTSAEPIYKATNFNPRFHERSDFKLVSCIFLFCHFNPRFHERSDLIRVIIMVL